MSRKKQSIRVVFDVLDEKKHPIRQDQTLYVTATDPDEAIDWAFIEMQRQCNSVAIHLARVRISA